MGATSPLLDGLGGLYLEDCDIAPLHLRSDDRKGVAPYAVDANSAEWLWAVTELWSS